MILSKFSLTIIIILIAQSYFTQNKVPRFFSEKLMRLQTDSLKTTYSNNKSFYGKYELQALVALSFYPELKNTSISFKRKKLKSTMVARPKGIQVLRRKGKRHYVIYINDFSSAKVPVDSASFNAQIGVIGHELAHIVEYESVSSLKIMYMGMAYFNKKFKTQFERATDQRAIDHGLLWQCYDFAVFVYAYKNTPPEYLKKKKLNYMSPEEIKAQEGGD